METDMTGKLLFYVSVAAVVGIVYLGWKYTARGAYESAEYTVLDSSRSFEIRKYPDLFVASTNAQIESQGNDGSFMRLFRYITGANDQEQKIAMTTPVFMEATTDESRGRMGFVLPRNVAQQGIPRPSNENIQIQKRAGGRFAVIRFSGRIERNSLTAAETKLREWMEREGMIGDGDAETAGYDPPWTPGPLRRNEVLIRLK